MSASTSKMGPGGGLSPLVPVCGCRSTAASPADPGGLLWPALVCTAGLPGRTGPVETCMEHTPHTLLQVHVLMVLAAEWEAPEAPEPTWEGRARGVSRFTLQAPPRQQEQTELSVPPWKKACLPPRTRLASRHPHKGRLHCTPHCLLTPASGHTALPTPANAVAGSELMPGQQ